MNFEPSNYFFEIMRWKSISKAAHQLGITQPALSRYLKLVESKVGKKLYSYCNKSITLTGAGQEFAAFLKDRMELEKSFLNRINQEYYEPEGKITLLTTPDIANCWLMNYLAEYLNDHPKVRIRVITTDKKSRLEPGVDGIIGVKINRQDIESTFLAHSEIKFFASKDYLKKHGIPQRIADLNHHRLICLSHQVKSLTRDIVYLSDASSSNSYIPEPVLEVTSSMALKKAAESGIGIVALNTNYIDMHTSDLIEILPDFCPFKTDLYFSCSKRCRDHQPLQSLRHFFKIMSASSLEN